MKLTCHFPYEQLTHIFSRRNTFYPLGFFVKVIFIIAQLSKEKYMMMKPKIWKNEFHFKRINFLKRINSHYFKNWYRLVIFLSSNSFIFLDGVTSFYLSGFYVKVIFIAQLPKGNYMIMEPKLCKKWVWFLKDKTSDILDVVLIKRVISKPH